MQIAAILIATSIYPRLSLSNLSNAFNRQKSQSMVKNRECIRLQQLMRAL
jgi:hypothetical protein